MTVKKKESDWIRSIFLQISSWDGPSEGHGGAKIQGIVTDLLDWGYHKIKFRASRLLATEGIKQIEREGHTERKPQTRYIKCSESMHAWGRL